MGLTGVGDAENIAAAPDVGAPLGGSARPLAPIRYSRGMLTFLLAVGLGCGEPEVLSCEALEIGPAQDTCAADKLLAMPAEAIGEVAVLAGGIQDGMVRQAAVLRWVRDNAGQIRRVEGKALCVEMLAGRSRGKCERYIDAIHLNEGRPVGPGAVPRPD